MVKRFSSVKIGSYSTLYIRRMDNRAQDDSFLDDTTVEGKTAHCPFYLYLLPYNKLKSPLTNLQIRWVLMIQSKMSSGEPVVLKEIKRAGSPISLCFIRRGGRNSLNNPAKLN